MPTVQLFVDDSPESDEAVQLVQEAGVSYTMIWARGLDVPFARINSWAFYPRISGISRLIAALTNGNGNSGGKAQETAE